ncbi:MAG: outer membrane protein transport protein [Pseudomonadota bacterium]
MFQTTWGMVLRRSTSVIALSMTIMPATALAGAFQLNERSTKSQGMSFADSVSGAKDVTYGLFNPAAFSKVVDIEIGGNVSVVAPISDGRTDELLVNQGILIDGQVDPALPQVASPVPASFFGAQSSTDADRSGVIPSLAAAYRVNEDLVLAFGNRTPFGLTTENPNNFIGAGDGIQSSLLTVEAQFSASYNILDNLALGASLNVLFIDARLTSSALLLDGHEFEIGFSAGALWEPIPGTSIGLAYHHGYDIDIDEADIDFAAGFPNPALAGTSSEGTVSASLPATLQLGITQEITPDLRASLEARWINWSVFDSIDIDEDEFGFEASDPQDYEDAFFVAAGVEYDILDTTSVRFGMAWDQTPTQDFGSVEGRTVRVPDEDRLWVSVGASHDMQMFGHDMTIDAAYSYLHALNDPEVVIRTGPFAGSTVRYEGGAHIISLGGSLRF